MAELDEKSQGRRCRFRTLPNRLSDAMQSDMRRLSDDETVLLLETLLGKVTPAMRDEYLNGDRDAAASRMARDMLPQLRRFEIFLKD